MNLPDFATLLHEGATVHVTVTLPDGRTLVDDDAHISAFQPDGTVRAGIRGGMDVSFHLPVNVPKSAEWRPPLIQSHRHDDRVVSLFGWRSHSPRGGDAS